MTNAKAIPQTNSTQQAIPPPVPKSGVAKTGIGSPFSGKSCQFTNQDARCQRQGRRGFCCQAGSHHQKRLPVPRKPTVASPSASSLSEAEDAGQRAKIAVPANENALRWAPESVASDGRLGDGAWANCQGGGRQLGEPLGEGVRATVGCWATSGRAIGATLSDFGRGRGATKAYAVPRPGLGTRFAARHLCGTTCNHSLAKSTRTHFQRQRRVFRRPVGKADNHDRKQPGPCRSVVAGVPTSSLSPWVRLWCLETRCAADGSHRGAATRLRHAQADLSALTPSASRAPRNSRGRGSRIHWP